MSTRPADTGLPRNGDEERDRLTRTPIVALQADYRRALERRKILQSQLAHIERRLARLKHELESRAYDPFNPYDAPGYS